MEFLFEDRFVTQKGTIYLKYLGKYTTANKDVVLQEELKFKQLIGQKLKINGKESKLLDVEGKVCCNLIDHNCYICLLTDEEFTTNYSI